ncbi:hypothetical protein Dsin_012625 [Dipteronia sinensis]|uniref:MULE transposase domain-containing protein n=1 Tax=Dipteronia sinensis TaxID=43782 RepID=A0AAE0AJ99_9ROSI|nr:hypothetical protein Dsin_012625 [Dipteronia sinensis]
MSKLPYYKVKRQNYPYLLLLQLTEENQNDSSPSIVLQPESVTYSSHLPSNRWLILPISNPIILTVHRNPQLFKPIVLSIGILPAIEILAGQCPHLLQSSLTVQPPSSIELTLSSLKSTIVNRTWVSRDKAEFKLTSHVKTEDDTVTLSIMSDDDVDFVIIHEEKGWATINVEFVNKHEFQPPENPIQSACAISPIKQTDNLWSPSSTPNYKSVSGSNNPIGSQASPGFTSAGNDQATPASTTKHVVVDDNDSSESIDTSGRSDSSKTSDKEDEIGDDDGRQPAIEDGTEERGVSGAPNSSSPSMNTQWTVSRSELYSIKAVRSVDEFEKSSTKKSCGWVLRAWKSNMGTYWHVKSFVNEQTCDRNDNYNIEFKRRLLAYFYVLEQSNPRTVTKIKTELKNRFKYGFMAIGVSIDGFNYVIMPFICIDGTHLKARTRGVLLVAVCKDGNEMIYHLAFGFANSECTESWTCFLKKLRKLIQYLYRVMLVSDWHNGIFNAMEAIFPYAAHGVCAYHLAQNLKRFCKQMDDVN